MPVASALKTQRIIPWLDQENYYYGRDSRNALRDGILNSRHIIYFITLGMLDHRNGWCPMELAYCDILQKNFVGRGGNLMNIELPLFYVDRNDPQLTRSVWGSLRDRGPFYTPAAGNIIDWSVNQIADFLSREQALAFNQAKAYASNPPTAITTVPGMLERMTQFDPMTIS